MVLSRGHSARALGNEDEMVQVRWKPLGPMAPMGDDFSWDVEVCMKMLDEPPIMVI